MKDYELEEAQAWQVVRNRKFGHAALSVQKGHPLRLPAPDPVPCYKLPQRDPTCEQFQPPERKFFVSHRHKASFKDVNNSGRHHGLTNFLTSRDTVGRAAWRRNEPYRLAVPLSKDISHMNEQGGISINAILPKLEQISNRTDTHITIATPLNSEYTAHVWGTQISAQKAQKRLLALLSTLLEGFKNRNWARVSSVLPRQRQVLEKGLEEELKRQSFRQSIPVGVMFEYVGYFEWPVEDFQPQPIFGQSLEALDAIRMDQRCFITLDAELSAFCVKGTDPAKIKIALAMLRTTLCQVLAQGSERPATLYLFDKIANSSQYEIHLKPYSTSRQLNANQNVVVELSLSNLGGQIQPANQYEVQVRTRKNTEKAKRCICRSLHTLQFLRGIIRMRARLGTFVLTKYKIDNVMTLAEFEAMAAQEQFAAVVTSGLGNKTLEDEIKVRFSHANNFLLPGDASTKTLKDVKPLYTGIIVVAGIDNYGPIRIEAQYALENGIPVQVSIKCSRTSNHGEQRSKFLNINFVDLEKPLAWNLEISASSPIDYKSFHALSAFIDGIELNVKIATGIESSQSGRFIDIKFTTLEVISIQQRKTWRYSLMGSSYICELSTEQDLSFTINSLTSQPTHEHPREVHAPQWGLTVHHSKWDYFFEENANLSIGNKVGWESSIETFFPAPRTEADRTKNRDGFEEFIATLKELSMLVNDEK